MLMVDMRIFAILAVLLLLVSASADAQQTRKKKREKASKSVQKPAEPEIVPMVEIEPLPADTDTIVVPIIEEPKDRTDTIYYDKSWRVIGNKDFATYYRCALYPVDSLAPKYFKTFYLDGNIQGEGNFIELGAKDDTNSVFDGEVTYYYKDGSVRQVVSYSDGKLNGDCTDYYENGNIKKHIVMVGGKQDGILASFSEDGKVCRLQEVKDDVPAKYYVIVDKDGNYSKFDAATEKPLLEIPETSEVQKEYKNGVAWPYYNKNGLIVGVSNSMVKENIGDFREIGVFLVNKSMVNVELDPAKIEVYSMKKGKRNDFELMPADEYDEEVYKKKMKNTKKQLKRKAVVTIERESNVSENLGASVFDAGTSHTLKTFQEGIIKLKSLVSGTKMRYSDREHEELGYLERTTVHPGEVMSGFLLTSDKKVDMLCVKLTINGVPYLYEWNTSKK